jgi:hypothetical protein
MQFVLCILLLAVRSGQASETPKGWSDWVSEGQALSNAGRYSTAAHAFRKSFKKGISRHIFPDRGYFAWHPAPT